MSFPFSLSAADQRARLYLLHQLAWITAPNSSVMTFLLKLQPHIAQSLRLVDVCQRHQEALETEEWSDWWFKVIHMKSMWIGPCHILCSLLVGIGLNKMETSATRLIQNIEHCPTRSLWNVPCGKLSSWSQSSMIGAANLFQANLALCCPKLVVFGIKDISKRKRLFHHAPRVFWIRSTFHRVNLWGAKLVEIVSTQARNALGYSQALKLFWKVTWIQKAYDRPTLLMDFLLEVFEMSINVRSWNFTVKIWKTKRWIPKPHWQLTCFFFVVVCCKIEGFYVYKCMHVRCRNVLVSSFHLTWFMDVCVKPR